MSQDPIVSVTTHDMTRKLSEKATELGQFEIGETVTNMHLLNHLTLTSSGRTSFLLTRSMHIGQKIPKFRCAAVLRVVAVAAPSSSIGRRDLASFA